MAPLPIIHDPELEAICNILGDTANGLTGSEIGSLLRSCNINDPHPSITKRHRLFQALKEQQVRDCCGNNVIMFIKMCMNPARYISNREVFETRRSNVNQALAFIGLFVQEDGNIIATSIARTLTEAQERATKLRRELTHRNVHPDILRFCRAELLQDNYFHAVFEATKSVADKIRDKSGLSGDGAQLVDQAFGFNSTTLPILAFNSLQSETEQGEQRGLMNLMKGLFGTFRNTHAHAPKIKWHISEQDALDMLSFASLLHRRLDEAVRTR